MGYLFPEEVYNPNMEINQFITKRYYDKDANLYRIELEGQDKDKFISVVKYTNAFPLILDEVKRIFLLHYMEYVKVRIDDENYLIYEHYDESVPLEEHTGRKNITAIRRLFVFNWLMCINSNHESKIRVFTSDLNDIKGSKMTSVAMIVERSYNLKPDNFPISKSIMDRWFDGNNINFERTLKFMIENISPNTLKSNLNKIVNRYDNDFSWWVNLVIDRIMQLSSVKN